MCLTTVQYDETTHYSQPGIFSSVSNCQNGNEMSRGLTHRFCIILKVQSVVILLSFLFELLYVGDINAHTHTGIPNLSYTIRYERLCDTQSLSWPFLCYNYTNWVD